MKRWLCVLCVIALLVGTCAGCKKEPDAPLSLMEAQTYTAFPEELTATKIGSLEQNISTATGGLYYRIGQKYGIMTFDGKVDSGAIYEMCRPLGEYFMVAKTMGSESDAKSFNTAGVVDVQGNVLVPLTYASVVSVDSRFVRVAEITGTMAEKDGSITNYKSSAGDTVYCAGNWYLYDLTTGKKIPNATGTKPYAAYSYGGKYVKYVTDDKVQHVVTPEGDALPAEAEHLKNGYYSIPAENAVYDAYGKQMFTYDPNGYVPCDDQDVSDYIVAKKTAGGKDTYVIMDLSGKVVSGELSGKPAICGKLLLIDKKVYNFDGKQLLPEEGNALYMDAVTKQAWMITSAATKEKFLLDQQGNILHRSGTVETTFNVNNFDMHRKDGENDPYHLVLKDGTYDLKGVAVAPWLVKTTNEDKTVNLVETISGKTLLENCQNVLVALAGGEILYVYAKTGESAYDIYRIG